MNNSFLQILKEYFSALDEKDIPVGNKHSIKIPFDWIYSKELTPAIQSTVVRLLEKSNPNFRKAATYKGHNPDVVEYFHISINKYTQELGVFVMGSDDWSKLLITGSVDSHVKIPQITEEDFIKELTKTLNADRTAQLMNCNLGLEGNARKAFELKMTSFLESQEILDDTSIKMCKVAKNLTQYYEYMAQKSEKANVRYGGIINQREDRRYQKHHGNSISVERKSPIYSFEEREKIFTDLNPEQIIVNGSLNEEGELDKNAFTTFVYSNPRGKDGYLCACEPSEGTKQTRMFFIPREAYDNFECSNDSDKLEEIIKKYLEMSNDEFYVAKHTKTLKHTDLDGFSSRVQYLITGKSNPYVDKYPSLYKQYDEQLFEGKVVSRPGIKKAISSLNSQTLAAGENLLKSLKTINKNKEEI